MSQPDWRRVEEIFNSASELTRDARPAFLDEACAGNRDLRRQVELLLSNDRQAGAKPGLWPGSIIPTSARSMALKNRVPSIAWSWNWSKEKHSAVR